MAKPDATLVSAAEEDEAVVAAAAAVEPEAVPVAVWLPVEEEEDEP